MRDHHGVRHHVFGLASGFIAVLLAFAMSASAADFIPNGQPIPASIRWVNSTATGIDTSAFAKMGTQTMKFPVPVSASTLGNLAKAAVRRGLPLAGWAYAFKEIVNGAGYLINELTKQVTTPGSPQAPLAGGTYCVARQSWGGTSTAQRCSSDPQSAPYPTAPAAPFANYAGAIQSGGQWMAEYVRQDSQGSYYMPITFYANPPTTNVTNGNPSTAPQEITVEQLGQLLKNQPFILNAVLIDMDTGAPIRTPELVDALNRLRKAYEAANGLPAGVDLVADPTSGQVPTPSQAAPEEAASVSVEFPNFCSWASVVCDFIDWYKNDDVPDVPLPETELNITPSDWSSGIGNGECPVAESVFVDGPGARGEVSFDWTPICQGAVKLRPVLLAVCVMVGGFIIAGLRKGSV